MEDSVFTKIIKRELPAEILYEDDRVIVILDRFPNTLGQTLVIPKRVHDYLFTLPEDEYTYLLHITKKVARALDSVYNTKRTCMVVEGFDVPHIHIRLYPIVDTPLSLAGGQMASDADLSREGVRIREALAL